MSVKQLQDIHNTSRSLSVAVIGFSEAKLLANIEKYLELLNDPETKQILDFCRKKISENIYSDDELKNSLMEGIRQQPQFSSVSEYSLKFQIKRIKDQLESEISMYESDGKMGGFSTQYLNRKWDDFKMRSTAKTEIFEQLLEIDIKNGADISRILFYVCSSGNFELLKLKIWNEQVIKFEYRSSLGASIFQALFEQHRKMSLGTKDIDILTMQVNDGFDNLIEIAELQLGTRALNMILQKPSQTGQTLFQSASLYSEYITRNLLNRPIKIDFINTSFETPNFRFSSCVSDMLKKNVNPFVSDAEDQKPYNTWKGNFVGTNEELLAPFCDGMLKQAQTDIYYTTLEGNCNMFDCTKADCDDGMEPFKCYTGEKSVVQCNSVQTGNRFISTIFLLGPFLAKMSNQ